MSFYKHFIRAIGDDSRCTLPSVIPHRLIQGRFFLQNDVGSGIDPPELPLPLLTIGIDTRLSHDEGSGQKLQVSVDQQVLVVYQFPSWMVKEASGQDVLDIE